MIRVLCKVCNSEVSDLPSYKKCCGCPNMTSIHNDKVTAKDLSQVVFLSLPKQRNAKSVFSPSDLAYQEERNKRKVRKLDFEVR